MLGLALIVVLVAGYFLLSNRSPQTQTNLTPTPTETSPSPSASPATSSAQLQTTSVKITSSGFVPTTVTIKAGDSVTWTNDDTSIHTVNSSPHPTHTDYAPLNLNQLKSGESKSLTFPQAGTYKYHNHLRPSLTGSVVVQ